MPSSAPTSFCDIETGPESSSTIRRFTKPFKVFDEAKTITQIKRDYVTARDPLKGADFIANKLSALREQHSVEEGEYWDNAFEKAALSPLTGRVLAIGIRQDGKSTILTAENDKQERDMLGDFLNHHAAMKSAGGTIIGFNWESFDNGFLRARCQKHRLPWQNLQQGRYMDSTFRDLMHDFTGYDKTKFVKLDTLSDFLGTGVRKNGDGAHFHQVFKDDRPKAIAYLENDLLMTEGCALALGVVPGLSNNITASREAEVDAFFAGREGRYTLPEPLIPKVELSPAGVGA